MQPLLLSFLHDMLSAPSSGNPVSQTFSAFHSDLHLNASLQSKPTEHFG